MANVFPPLHTIRPVTSGQHLELELLQRLAIGLPEPYALFHNIDWAQAHATGDRHGELDIVVVNAAGDVAILEIKAGTVDVRDGTLVKRYGDVHKNVVRQSTRQHAVILSRLRNNGLEVRVLHFLVLPHQRVGLAETAAYPRERILDVGDCEDLCGALERRLGLGFNDPAIRERVHAFMGDRVSGIVDVGSVDRRLQEVTRRVSGGLADWVPRITAPEGVIRVVATAGSGKTQLALRLLREAQVQGRRAAYVCYNRPLADHVRSLLPTALEVATFHQRCWEAAGRPIGALDFEALAAAFRDAPVETDYDLLVIDEVQDLRLDWVAALLRSVTPDASVVMLDDPAQCLYDDREELDIPQAVVVRSADNFRSPRRVVDVINALALTDSPVVACALHDGELPGMRTWSAADGPHGATAAAVRSCLDQGFQPTDVAVVTWRGRERSQLSGATLDRWTLSRFSGNYDERGEPVWTAGQLKLETLRRMKGQSAAAVVLTEIDFETLGQAERRMLFVGMTRARLHLELVLSERAEAALARALAADEPI